jgi:hypothetical protein
MSATLGRTLVGSLIYFCGELQDTSDAVLNNEDVITLLRKIDGDLSDLSSFIEDIDPTTGEAKDL